MKTTLLILATVFANSAFAQVIVNSDLEAEHQQVIVQALSIHCAVPYRSLSQTAPSLVKISKTDNGITDVEFVTVLGGHGFTIRVTSFHNATLNVGNDSRYSVTNIESDYCKH